MRKKIFFIKHIALEGPGSMGTFFEKAGFQTQDIDLYAGDEMPDNVRGVAAVISLGGPMNVDEEEKYPFLKKEDAFIKKVLSERIPFLGICLGSQLLAKACGAKVIKLPKPEIGIFDVKLRPEGKEDRIFRSIETAFKVFQWHEDMFEIAPKALWLSVSEACPHQAFRMGDRAYGFQFHVEVDRAMIISWMKAYWRIENVVDCEKARNLLAQYDKVRAQLCQVAEHLYNNFAAIINEAN